MYQPSFLISPSSHQTHRRWPFNYTKVVYHHDSLHDNGKKTSSGQWFRPRLMNLQQCANHRLIINVSMPHALCSDGHRQVWVLIHASQASLEAPFMRTYSFLAPLEIIDNYPLGLTSTLCRVIGSRLEVKLSSLLHFSDFTQKVLLNYYWFCRLRFFLVFIHFHLVFMEQRLVMARYIVKWENANPV